MKHLKTFEALAGFQAVMETLDRPGVSLVKTGMQLFYLPYITPVNPVQQHDYVEIGGIKWATMNLGANSITDAGRYYQWGDIQGYTEEQAISMYNSNSLIDYYRFYGDGLYISKYNENDGLHELVPSDDAASVTWGGHWRIPTISEWQTLMESVNTTYTSDYQGSGIAGLICTDKTDSSKILFFPNSNYNQSITNQGTYWSKTLDASCSGMHAYNFSFMENDIDYYLPLRHELNNIRPIYMDDPVILQPEYIEIGGIKWATMNLGANRVTEKGNYYQWGDTRGWTTEQINNGYVNVSDASYYKYYSGGDTYTKYNETDKLCTLLPVDDPVTVTWGSNWRTPTADEWLILMESVNTSWTSDYQGSGVAGIICTDKTDNTKVLFFPSMGTASDLINNNGNEDEGSDYMTSQLDLSSGYGYGLCSYFMIDFRNNQISTYLNYHSRFDAYPIRGIYDESISTHDYVEIGGVKWATMNLGAKSITDKGLYYQWGDTQGCSAMGIKLMHKKFERSDCPYYNEENISFTKYNETDELFTLQASDDAAVATWGGNWRMPTVSEWQSLINATNYEWTSSYQGSGIAGMVFTDKTDNTKVLFFPLTYSSDSVNNDHSQDNYHNSYYMVSQLDLASGYGYDYCSSITMSSHMNESSQKNGTIYIEYIGRERGGTIRAVLDDSNS